MLKKSQQGITFWQVLILVPMVGFFILMGLKLIPVYMEDGAIKNALDSMSREPEGYTTTNTVQGAFSKRIAINNVKSVTIDDLKIERNGPFFNVSIDYEVKIPLVSNISVLVEFSHDAQVPAL